MGWGKLLANLGAIAITGGIALALQYPLLNQRLGGQTPESDRRAEREEAIRLAVLQNLPARGFGFNNLLADYAFMQFLQYFGDETARVEHNLGYGLTKDYFRMIIQRDPRFLPAYFYMSVSLSMFAAQPHEAIQLYDLGLQRLDPRTQRFAYNVWRLKANDQLLFLGDVEGARASLLKVAEWAQQATFKPEDSPPPKLVIASAQELAQLLSTKKPEDIRSAQVSMWQLVLASAMDRKTIERIGMEVDKLGFKIDVRTVDNRPQLVIVPK